MTDPYASIATPPTAPAQPTQGAQPLADPYAAMANAPAPTQEDSLRQFGHFLATGYVQPTGNDALDSAQHFINGAVTSAAEVPAMVLQHVAPRTKLAADAANFVKEQQAQSEGTLSYTLGSGLENIAEWMVGEKALRGLSVADKMKTLTPVVSMLEKYPKIAEAAAAHPDIARFLPDAIRQGILGTTQTAAHGGTAAQSLESGAVAGSLGLALPMAIGAAAGRVAQNAEAYRPLVKEFAGTEAPGAGNFPVSITQTAAEQLGPGGVSQAPEKVQQLIQEGLPADVKAQRQLAFQQMQTNLAKKGVGNFLENVNDAIRTSSAHPDIQQVVGVNPEWRYVPPDGSMSLTADEAQNALNELKQRWLDTDLSDRQTGQMQAAYNDLREQIQRHGDFIAGQPIQFHDVNAAVNGVQDYGDAADRVRLAARQMMGQATPEVQSAYNDLLSQRDSAQSAFDQSRYNPAARQQALQRISEIHDQLEQLANHPGVNLSPEMAEQARNATRLSNGFQDLQNTMDNHFTLRQATAEQLPGRARVSRNLEGLSDNIEAVRSRYGDVLNPVIGDNALNHIIELGDIIKNQPEKTQEIGNLMDNMGAVLRRHWRGIRGVMGVAGAGGLAYITHQIAHGIAGPAGALGVLSVEAANRIMLRKIATDPEFAARAIYALRNNIPPRVAAPVIASLANLGTRAVQNQPTEDQYAPPQ